MERTAVSFASHFNLEICKGTVSYSYKVKKAGDIKQLKALPEQFIEAMAQKVPEYFLKIFRDCIELLLKRINVPDKEIEQITEKIYERRFNTMFDIIDGYDVQATRKQAREEALKEFEYDVQATRKQAKEEAEKKFAKEIKNKDEEIKKLQARIKELESK